MTSLQKNIISMILPFALWALEINSQIVVSTTFPSNQEINEQYPGFRRITLTKPYSSNTVEKIPINELKDILSKSSLL